MKFLYALALSMVPAALFAEAPTGYYNKCEGLNGAQLLQALESVVSDHQDLGYGGLWTLYRTSDTYPDGTIWDIYSTKHWQYGDEQCGSYTNVGDCYNREHSLPKSWFYQQYPMYDDAFHIYPTDGRVNSQRSNYPYGECANGVTLSGYGGVKALGRLGECTYPGYSGTVFEPADEYKGDLARSYFYMAACYNSLIDDWNSAMLAGNSYPAFTPWAMEMLMKWHRQDPVSQKELDRQEAIYAQQGNRNPFIDYPAMAEFIWGDKKKEKWSSTSDNAPTLALPVDGSVRSFGYVAVNSEATIEVTVKGAFLTSAVTIERADQWFDIDKSSISAQAANMPDGAVVTLKWNPKKAGSYSSTLTFASGSATTRIQVEGEAVDKLVAKAAKNVSDREFTASWVYVGDDDNGIYDVCYKTADATEGFYAVKADAKAGECTIDGLMPSTKYEYWLQSKTMKSNVVEFATGEGVPYIQLLYDGELYLEAAPGEPSSAYEVIVESENITEEIKISVSAPFELSSDKSSWAKSIAIDPEEDRFYLRLNSKDAGIFTTVVKLESGYYVNDDIEVSGCVSDGPTFVEGFENDASGCGTYNGCEYQGAKAVWYLSNAGIWISDEKYAHDGVQCVRMGKNADSCIEMRSDKPRGIGTVTLYARCWSAKEGKCTFHIEYSLDQGHTWASTTDATVESEAHQMFTFAVNMPGNGRIRIAQSQGARFVVDEVAISDCVTTGLEGVESDYKSWDAYCKDGELVVEMACEGAARIYGVDGIVYFDDTIPAGTSRYALPKGLYIVSVADFARRVMVK